MAKIYHMRGRMKRPGDGIRKKKEGERLHNEENP
jgi:hypothetical protein